MPPPPGHTATGEPVAHALVNPSISPAAPGLERGWLRTLSVVAIGLFLLLSIGLLVTQREAALDMAKAQAQREVKRLAAELQASLRVARASMDVANFSPNFDSAQLLDDHRPLVEALNLPFDLRMTGPATAGQPTGQWLPGLAREEAGKWVVPLIWNAPPAEGGQATEVLLDRQALLDRLASEGMPPGGSMSLFRIEDDGATTVLARYPMVEKDQGRTVRGHVADALQKDSGGVMQVVSVIDGVPRIVGYQRLNDGAERLAMVYALPVAGVLAAWTAVLPLAIALSLLVAGAMAYGAWRLDRAIQQRHRSERHFQTLNNHLPDVVVRYDQHLRILYANPAIEGAHGLKPAAVLGRTLSEIGAPQTLAEQWRAYIEGVFKTGQGSTLYFSYPGPQGMRHWEAQAVLEPALPGDRPTVLAVSRDITERHEAEARRLSAQQLFESVFQAAPEAMSLADWDSGRMLLVNDAFCTLFGRPREQLIGATSTELGLWRSTENRQRLLAALEKGDKVRDAQGQSQRPDGREIHVRYSAERVTVDGQVRLLLMFRDVTQLELDQRALVRSEQRFRLAASHGQVWEWDFGQGFVTPSDEFFVALGHPSPPQSQMGTRFLDLIHPEDLPRLHMAMRGFFKGDGDYQLEFRARDAQGRYHWFDTRGSGLRDASGRVTYMAGTTFDISDRKALEEAQRQTLARLETLTNASEALLWTSGTDGMCDWVNQRWLDFTGQPRDEVVGSGWTTHVHPDDLPDVVRAYEDAREARVPYSSEFRLRNAAGEYRWLLEQSYPRYDADNRFIGYICSCVDVTDFKQAEATARERGAMLEQVFDVLKDMLFVLDAQERFVFFQAGSEERLYRRPEEFLGQPMAAVMPPDLVQPLREAMQRAREQGLQELDYSLDLPLGTHFFNARLAWLPGGEQCMFLVRDVTGQQKDRKERERLNAFVLLLFRLASRFINLPLLQMDAAIDAALGDMGDFVGADRAYLFTYDHQAGTATNTHEWCAPGIQTQKARWQAFTVSHRDEWYVAHLRGEKVLVPDRNDLPDNDLRRLLTVMDIQGLLTLPLMNGDDCLGYVGLDSVNQPRAYGHEEVTLLELFAQMLVNLRLRALAAAQVQEMTEQLEHKVEERTRQLNESVQRLQTVNRELESFTYSASHDLRTPLRGIEGFSTLLLDEHADQLDEQGHEYLRRIQKATLHMSQLVSDLLAYSRLQQLTGQAQPVRLAASVQAVATPFRDELEARQGQLSVVMPEELRVLANPKGLDIVLRNLIDNALKFTPASDAPRLRIEAQAEGDRVRLSVSDQGIGFDMKYHDRIFGMFQRLHRQDQIPGTGIGLALVQKAVERMGGQIRAESAPGQGATFYIELPRA